VGKPGAGALQPLIVGFQRRDGIHYLVEVIPIGKILDNIEMLCDIADGLHILATGLEASQQAGNLLPVPVAVCVPFKSRQCIH